MKTMPIAMLISISFAASPSWGCWWDRPVIKTGIADSMTSPTQLTITGKRFGSAEPIVNLAGLTLVVTAFTPTSVTATLPPSLTPGSYVLTVAKKHERYCIGAFDLTLGAVGPKGDMGAVGPEGSRGPEGPGGPAGFPGAPGPSDLFVAREIQSPQLNNDTDIVSVSVPAGNYLILATMIAQFIDDDPQTLQCAFKTTPGSAIGGQGTVSRTDLDHGTVPVAFQEVVTFAQPTIITMHCGGFRIGVNQVVLSAVKIGACHSNAGDNCGVF